MSISNVRQRKLFKNGKGVLLNRLLTQSSNYQDEQQQIQHIRTEVSEHRDSYSSRPTLNSSHLSRQLTILQNKINKQQAITQKYFQQMENLQNYYEKLMKKQNQKYQYKLNQLRERIRKQSQRNKKTLQRNNQFVQKIILKILIQSQRDDCSINQFQREQNIKGISSKQIIEARCKIEGNKKLAMDFLQLIKFELSRRQIQKMGINFQSSDQRGQQQETFILDIKLGQEQRQSESILLDDSSIV